MILIRYFIKLEFLFNLKNYRPID